MRYGWKPRRFLKYAKTPPPPPKGLFNPPPRVPALPFLVDVRSDHFADQQVHRAGLQIRGVAEQAHEDPRFAHDRRVGIGPHPTLGIEYAKHRLGGLAKAAHGRLVEVAVEHRLALARGGRPVDFEHVGHVLRCIERPEGEAPRQRSPALLTHQLARSSTQVLLDRLRQRQHGDAPSLARYHTQPRMSSCKAPVEPSRGRTAKELDPRAGSCDNLPSRAPSICHCVQYATIAHIHRLPAKPFGSRTSTRPHEASPT